MKRKMPIGYGSAGGGRGMAVFISVWAGFLISRIISIPNAIYTVRILVIVVGIVDLLFILADVTTNLKRRGKNKYMYDMLRAPYVVGEITKVTPIHIRTRQEIQPHEHVKLSNRIYLLTIEYRDPFTNEMCTLTTEPYYDNPDVFLSGRRAEVHYDMDGSRWAEPVEYRTSQGERSIGENQKRSDRSYWIHEHSAGLSIAMFAVTVLVIILFLKITGG